MKTQNRFLKHMVLASMVVAFVVNNVQASSPAEQSGLVSSNAQGQEVERNSFGNVPNRKLSTFYTIANIANLACGAGLMFVVSSKCENKPGNYLPMITTIGSFLPFWHMSWVLEYKASLYRPDRKNSR